MAVITFDIKELTELIGKSRPPKEIADAFENLGMPVDKLTDDSITIDLTPDRIDMFTIEGAARAVSHFLGISEPKKYTMEKAKTVLNVDNVPMRPYVVAGIAYGVDLNENLLKALIMAQEKIHETFGRKRKRVAIGIHDFDKTTPPYSYRAFKHTLFVPLDSDKEMSPQDVLTKHPKGIEYASIYAGIDSYPLVLDSKGVLSFPPIINSERSRLTPETKNLFIDVTGTSEHAVRDTLHIFLTALYDRGARIENVKLKLIPQGEKDSAIFERKEKLDLGFSNKLLGQRFTPDQAVDLLKRMGHVVEKNPQGDIMLNVPPYRTDILHQVDFAEDIAIAYGYSNFKPKLPAYATVAHELKHRHTEHDLRSDLISLGFQEVITWTLTNQETERAALIGEDAAEIKNPRTTDFTRFRTSLLPSMLTTLAINKTKGMPQRFFEIGRVADAKGNCSTRVACVITNRSVSFSEIKGVYEVINERLHTSYKEKDFKCCIPGRSIAVLSQKHKTEIGWCGEVHPQLIENFKLENPIAALEILLTQ
jgi:phenylalanyl-tRNA synthetase beta chain